ncbi:MAG: carboxylesterase family protein [Clostridiales bacterium]|jgi:para-nitrobenzyl esterase|nr:carboxylesterase family protein [Clostridiales bacterium]
MDVKIKTRYGTVVGYESKGIRIFKGIPYVEPPIGELRFCEPREVEPWEGERQAKKFGAVCPQVMSIVPLGRQSEDCLYLNIFAPKTEGKKPVLVFIHGGAYVLGAGSQTVYHGAAIAEKDVVFVTFNYRLGAVGMMDYSFLDGAFASNIALKDQAAALKWVNENIEAFGGDKSDVTLMGQSAGAISVVALLNVPSVRGYFKKAIALSAFPDMIKSKEESAVYAREFCEYAEIETKEDLLAWDSVELSKALKRFLDTKPRRLGLDYVMPCADGEFLPQKPLKVVGGENGNHIPLLMGYTKEELNVLFSLPVRRIRSMSGTETDLLFRTASESGEPLEELYSPKSGRALLMRDWLIRVPSERYAEGNGKYAPTWIYRFDYSPAALKLIGVKAVHAIDLVFIFKAFKNIIADGMLVFSPFRKDIYALADRMRDTIVDFAKSSRCEWEQFNENGALKIFDATADRVETGGIERKELLEKLRERLESDN